METTSTYPVHPGCILGEELKARGILQKDFAAQIGMQASHLSAIITGVRNITPALAEKISSGLSDVPASFWVDAQEHYNSYMRRAKVHPSLLISSYVNPSNTTQAALEEPGVVYGTPSTMKTTAVVLGTHFDDFIHSSVLSGRYSDASEVVRSGLRLLEEQERKMAMLRSVIEEGFASGCIQDFDPEAFLQQMKARKHGKV